MMPEIRTYSELIQLETFKERYDYLRIKGILGDRTFGFDRWINQRFYKSHEWKMVRRYVILRDHGCDLAVPGYEIHTGLLIHHMNPLTLKEIAAGEPGALDPNFLITTSLTTHNAIHYGDESQLPRGPIERQRGDTQLW